MHDPSPHRPVHRGAAGWPTSRGLLCFLFALAAGACGSDLFHSTEWDTVCKSNPNASGCGEGGADGGGDPGNCIKCLDLVPAAAPRPAVSDLCSTTLDAYALLDECRCAEGAPCLAACETTPTCGGTATDVIACDDCAKQNCGELIEACAAPPP
ncbi:hypothetical protein [Polyangium aurulentum]|uniref:hypothetical protein n=1 Tax=Polyangium aurulentum TaxID=2567896 RepID=UPI0010AE8C8B|nr:hypothetical protein [Polyangium aurulentum]UQA59000.1 hypothetical protein E8A73_000310 [Polyangium aurulentum]